MSNLYDESGRFIGEHGSPEHKAHIAQIAHANDFHDVIQALIAFDDPKAEIAKRTEAALELADLRETSPKAYAEAIAKYQAKLAEIFGGALKLPKPPFNPSASRIGDVFSAPPRAPAFIVDKLLPQAHGVENAIGGAGKTTRHLREAIQVILGRDLYGQRVLKPGPVLFVTKEDDEALFRWRIHQVAQYVPDLSEADCKRLREHLHVLVLTGSTDRLVVADRQGKFTHTDLTDRIVRGYEQEGLALLDFDPINLFGPGDESNQSEAETMTVLARISQELRCCVRGTSHVAKAVGREGTSDAHSGRGGSAKGDHARFVWNFWRHGPERDKGRVVPYELQSAADAGDLYWLDIVKLSAAKPAFERVWITRRGFSFEWRADTATTPQARRDAAADADAQKVLAYLLAAREKNGCYTQRELEDESATVGIGQKRIRAALQRLKVRGQVVDAEIPEELRKGGRKTYLEPVEPTPAPLDTSRPIAEQMGA